MKSPRRFALLLAGLLAPLAAFAHPGHDGPHDLEWDFDHFAAHPVATLACLLAVGLAAWAVRRLLCSSRSSGSQPGQ